MATAAAAARGPKELTYSWEGKDKAGAVINPSTPVTSLEDVARDLDFGMARTTRQLFDGGAIEIAGREIHA